MPNRLTFDRCTGSLTATRGSGQNDYPMNARVFSLWLATLLLRLATPLAAQDPGFVLQGEGGLVTALVLDPSTPTTVYAATALGLFKSADGGANWRKTGSGLRDHSVLALAVDPLATSNLYATTDAGGVFRSADAGEHWTEANEGLAARYVGAIAVDPHHPGTVFAGAEAGRIFRSGDGGGTWKELSAPTVRVAITAIGIDPAPPGTLFAGTNSEGIFWSVDGATTWSHPSGRLSKGTVWSVMFSGAPGTMFVATHDGLFRSDGSGTAWTPINRGLRSWNVLSLASDPSAPATLYAGTAGAIYKSADAGQSWTELQADLYVSALAIDPRAPSTLYAATHLGVIKSTDGGAKWTALHLAGAPAESQVAAPLPKLPIRSTALPAQGTDRLPPLPVAPRSGAPASPPLPPLPVKPPGRA